MKTIILSCSVYTHRAHRSVPQSCDVRILPVVLPDVLNRRRAKLGEQLVGLKWKQRAAVVSKNQKPTNIPSVWKKVFLS